MAVIPIRDWRLEDKKNKKAGHTQIEIKQVVKDEVSLMPEIKTTKPEPIKKITTPPVKTTNKKSCVCGSCEYKFEYTGKSLPKKCPKCGDKNVKILTEQDILKAKPVLNSKLFEPIVAYPYLLWSQKTDIPELQLTPADTELLSENLKEVAEFYMDDLMIKHGAVFMFTVAAAMVTLPKVFIMKQIQAARKEELTYKQVNEGENIISKHKTAVIHGKKESSNIKSKELELMRKLKGGN